MKWIKGPRHGGGGYSLKGLVRYVPLEGMVFKVKQKNIFYLRRCHFSGVRDEDLIWNRVYIYRQVQRFATVQDKVNEQKAFKFE